MRVLLFAVLVINGAGCASARKKKEPAPKVVKPAFVGTVSLVNEKSQFVLIDNGLLPIPPAGLELKSYTDGVESGELITSAARKRPFTIADIRSGEPKKGDRVFVATKAREALPVVPEDGTTPGGNQPPPLPPNMLPPFQLSPMPWDDQKTE